MQALPTVVVDAGGDLVYCPANSDLRLAIAGFVFARAVWNLQTRWDTLDSQDLPAHVWFRDGDRTNLLPSNLTINRTSRNVHVKVWFP